MTEVPAEILQNANAHGLVWHEANSMGFLLLWHRRTQKSVHFWQGPVQAGSNWLPTPTQFLFNRVLVNSAWNTLIPAPLFEPNVISAYQKLHALEANTADKWDHVPTLDGKATLLFRHDVNAGTAEKIHVGALLLPIWKSLPLTNTHAVYAWLLDDILHLACFTSGQLCLYNSFKAAGMDETAYYLLYAAEQLEFKLSDCSFQIGGLPFAAEALEQLQKYIPQAKLLENLPGTVPLQLKMLMEQAALCA